MCNNHFVILVTENDDPISFWLSGSDLGREGDYVWMTSGQPLNYTEWYSGGDVQEPNHVIHGGDKEQCLTIRYGSDNKWNDRVCTDRNYFICDNQLWFGPQCLRSCWTSESLLDFTLFDAVIIATGQWLKQNSLKLYIICFYLYIVKCIMYLCIIIIEL